MPKRGAQGNGSIRQRPDGRWEARYTIGRNPGTGKQVQKSVYGDTQKEVRQKLNAIIKDIDDGVYKAPNRITVGDWLDIWTEEYLSSVKPSTIFNYKQTIRLHIKPALGAIKLDQLTTPAIQKLYNSLGKPRGDKKGLSPKSIKNAHGVLHKALQQAVAVGYLRFNPSGACIIPRVEQKEIIPLNDDQITAFLHAIKGHRHETLYKVAMFTGIREGELLGLMWDCVYFDTGTLLIDKQLQRHRVKGGEYYFSQPKNNKSRTITPAPWVMRLLKVHKAEQEAMKKDLGHLWQENGLVFTNETGGYLSYRTVYDCFKRIAAKIGCAEARFHDLRHTYAVSSIRAGDDIKTVQENMGHHTAAFTLDVYGHVTAQMKHDSANRMETFISAVLNL